ncbi:MAG: multidrug/biocide efflux PACE transporter [Polaromonas sp.]|nr:multidrug/biocide efflux PACE transporter [Polaromonas sp.]
MNLHKSAAERFLHALIFEVLAIAICAPVGAWLLGHSLAHMGALTLMISLVAMGWNMVFNALFDRAQWRWGFTRNLTARAVHALLFEIGLLLVIVPLAAWWLDMGLWHAFVLDIGIALFFMPYSFVFNWLYDKISDKVSDRISDKLQARCGPKPAEKF